MPKATSHPRSIVHLHPTPYVPPALEVAPSLSTNLGPPLPAESLPVERPLSAPVSPSSSTSSLSPLPPAPLALPSTATDISVSTLPHPPPLPSSPAKSPGGETTGRPSPSLEAAAARLARKQRKVLVTHAELGTTCTVRGKGKGEAGAGGAGSAAGEGEGAGIGLVLGEESKEGKSSVGASEWNRLLLWARKKRGVQWDRATKVFQVDYLSPEYYNPPQPLDPSNANPSNPSGPLNVVNANALPQTSQSLPQQQLQGRDKRPKLEHAGSSQMQTMMSAPAFGSLMGPPQGGSRSSKRTRN